MASTQAALVLSSLLIFMSLRTTMCTSCSAEKIEVTLGCDDERSLWIANFTNKNPVPVWDVHVTCGAFIDDPKWNHVDPQIVRRVGPKDCLIKGGRMMKPGEDLIFTYDNYWWIFKKMFSFQVIKVSC